MTIKHVALGLVLSALPMLVNCASPTEDSESGANAATESSEDSAKNEDDARVFSDAGPPSGPSSLACAVKDAIDTKKFAYRPARVEPGACTTSDLDDILAFVRANPEATFTDLHAEIRANYRESCASCILDDDAKTFGPIITQGGAVVSLNASGCIEIASGKGNACGRAHRAWDMCIDEACAQCDGAELSACREEVQGAACKAATTALTAACGNDVNALVQACRGSFGFDEAIRRQCVTGR